MSSQNKLSEKDREEIRHLYTNARLSSRKIARRFDICHTSVINLISGRTYEMQKSVRPPRVEIKPISFAIVKGITVSFK